MPAQGDRSSLDRDSFRFIVSLLFRLVNAFTTRTFFQPDEYFQAWEVAHDDVYGVGFRTWEWQAGIRSSLVPYLFQGLIRLSEIVQIDYLTLGKIFMAFLAAVADVYTAKLAEKLGRRNVALGRTSWVISLFSFFNWHCSTRPFSNTFEMILTSVALNYWYSDSIRTMIFSQVLAHIAIALRPSSGILWQLLGIDLLVSVKTWQKRLAIVLLSAAVMLSAQFALVVLDYNYYGGTTISYYEFVKHNFGSRISEIYGVNPWHWYISQGLPLLLLGYLPFLVLGWKKTPWKVRALLVINVAAFSLIPHKEFRFLYFLMPLLHFIVALGFTGVPIYVKALAILVNIVVGVYFSMFHQRGVYDVVTYIGNTPSITEVSFLMPCHSTPWHAHFQRRDDPTFKPQFLTCEPPWNITSEGYVDEADQFYAGPYRYLKSHPEKLTQTIVVFEPLEALLTEMGYDSYQRFNNGLYNEDRRRQGDVVVMNRRN